MSLSKREAFQMILDMIFSTEDGADINIDYLKEQIEEKVDDKKIIVPDSEIETIEPVKKDDGILGKLETPFKENNNKHTVTNRSSSGILYVYFDNSKDKWTYVKRKKDKKRITITDSSLKELEQKVKNRGLDWVIVDKEKAKKSYAQKSVKTVNRPNQNFNTKYGDAHYTFADSYKNYQHIVLNDDSTFKIGKYGYRNYENFILLRIFYNSPLDIKTMTKKDYLNLKEIFDNYDITHLTTLKIAYSFWYDFNHKGGECTDAVFEVFKNDYEVPFFVEFTSSDNELVINGQKTGILLTHLKNMINLLDESVNVEFDIVRLMYNNQTINQKYLFWTLMNYGNEHIRKIIKEA